MKLIPAEIYSRVSGYFRPVNQWNKGKREEFSERKSANIKEVQDVERLSNSGSRQNPGK